MTCRECIYSNECYDFIYSAREVNRQEEGREICIQRLNEQYSSVYFQQSGAPPLSIQEYSYSAIPKCYSLQDTTALEESGILRMQNLPVLQLKGSGVLMGFIDTGIDYTNPIFQTNDNRTRIEAIWDQTIDSDQTPPGFLYGREFLKEEIDEALANENPFDVVSSMDENGHGTFVAGVAAGGRTDAGDFTGAAPECAIAMVKVKEAKPYLKEFFQINPEALCFQENDLMAAVVYLDRLAFNLSMPLVICLSMGSSMGSHGGNMVLPELLNEVAAKIQRCVVVPTGNEGNERHHFQGVVEQEDVFEEVEINVGPGVEGFVTELWSVPPQIFAVSVRSPSGEEVPRIPGRLGVSEELSFVFEETRVRVDYATVGERDGNQLIHIRFQGPTEGLWTVRVFGEVIINGAFYMWLPPTELMTGEVFFLRSSPDMTIMVPGNASVPITVGGYDTKDKSLFIESGRGYTLDQVVKPELSAPAVNIYGPDLRQGFVRRTGTSSSAAITAGACALYMEWAIVKGNERFITTANVKNFLIRGAVRQPGRTYPNREFGYGTLELFRSFNVLRLT